MSNYLFIDLETRSMTDLKSAGAWRYSEDPEADVLCIAWALGLAPVTVCEPGDTRYAFTSKPPVDTFFVARNAQFEYAMFCNVLIPKYGFHKDFADPSRWICTAALSRMHGLPASLEESAEYLNKKFKKLPFGKDLIQKYCIPYTDKKTGEKKFRELTGEDRKRMFEYNKIDVESDREAFYTLINLPNADSERASFLHNFRLNAKGIKIDVPALDKLLTVFDAAAEQINNSQRKLMSTVTDSKGITKEKPLNVRSPKNLQAFLSARGYDIEDCKIETIEQVYDDADAAGDEEVKKVLAWRMFSAKASIKKLAALKNRVSPDGRLRYFLKYFGAHTGRYAGEGFQVHNLPKAKWPDGVEPCKEIDRMIKEININMPYKDLIDWGKKIIPGLMTPEKGNIFLAGDFAAVEARGIAWLAGCESALNQFISGIDLYVEMAKKINPAKPNRQLGKAVILGAGYSMGIDKFHATCLKWGIDIDKAIAEKAIDTYRKTFVEIPRFWYALEEAFRQTWLSKQPHTVGKYIRMERGGNYIKIRLPSGRWLFYHQVKIDADGMSFANLSKKGMRTKLYGGILAENITQAVCRDILDDRMFACEAAGLPVALDVHDEVICEVPEKQLAKARTEFDRIMNTAPEWAKGFPLKTESEIMTRYRK